MSLYKQLWLAIICLMMIAFSGSFVVSSLSARSYLEEQFYQKNIDNASSLALSLSAEQLDPTLIELYLNSQFDTGHYQFINLVDMNGSTIASQFDTRSYDEAPAWLMKAFPINVKPGVAQVSNGWQQVGTLSVSSHTRFLYKQLWTSSKLLFSYFFVISIVSGIVGSVLLRTLTRPLSTTVAHAEAIGQRRFITTAEPRTLEFKALIRSMNKLSEHVKDMLDNESEKLENWRKEMQYDKVTHLLNREPILSHLKTFTTNEDERAGGGILLIRVADLFVMNKQHGRHTMDVMLRHIGESLLVDCSSKLGRHGLAGRLNGSDFLIVMPGLGEHLEEKARELYENTCRVCRLNEMPELKLYGASTRYHVGEKIGAILSRSDSVLASAPEYDSRSFIHVEASAAGVLELNVADWRGFLAAALSENRFTFEHFPVMSCKDELLHLEAPARLIQADKSLLNAGQFMPHISRLNMGTQLDIVVTKLALQEISSNKVAVGINLSSSLLNEPRAMAEIAELIRQSGDAGESLWLEIPEFGVFQNIEGFRSFCNLIKPFNCKVGIEHVGQELVHIGKLHDLGLDYIKIDSSLIHNIDSTTSNQVFIRGLCTIVHSIGLVAIAEGVETVAEWNSLKTLGIDGGTGKYFPKLRH